MDTVPGTNFEWHTGINHILSTWSPDAAYLVPCLLVLILLCSVSTVYLQVAVIRLKVPVFEPLSRDTVKRNLSQNSQTKTLYE
jgi:hypothetical protein